MTVPSRAKIGQTTIPSIDVRSVSVACMGIANEPVRVWAELLTFACKVPLGLKANALSKALASALGIGPRLDRSGEGLAWWRVLIAIHAKMHVATFAYAFGWARVLSASESGESAGGFEPSKTCVLYVGAVLA